MFGYKSSIKQTNDGPNLEALQDAVAWVYHVVRTRLLLHFGQKSDYKDPLSVPEPASIKVLMAQVQEATALDTPGKLMVLMALMPHIQADFYDRLVAGVIPEAGDFPQFGGIRGNHHRGFIPTGETILFVLAGDSLPDRVKYFWLLDEDHPLRIQGICWVNAPEPGDPIPSGRITLAPEWVEYFTQGHLGTPRFSMQFPAQRITTEMDWENLILPAYTLQQVRELEIWLQHHQVIWEDWGMKKFLRPGYRALFHGPPGTGKTLTATLIGKHTGREVFRVDLSMVLSKFIGETEKNLGALFDRAASKGWILFFDEADALFGKRTQVRDAHDKYANQEVSYLLQRVEMHDGLVILASNQKNNIDDAFLRRFQQVIHFPLPKQNERLKLWEQSIPKALTPEPGLNLDLISQQYELSGATILNVVQYACLRAIDRQDQVLRLEDLTEGVRREFGKENKLA